MRATLVLLTLLLAPLALATPAGAAIRCEFNEQRQYIPPGSSVYVSVMRSSCWDDETRTNVHKEIVLVTEGNPDEPGHLVLARIEASSIRQRPLAGPDAITDTVTVQHNDAQVVATYKSTRTPLGFTSCETGADASWSRYVSFSARRALPQCLPHDNAEF